MPNDNDQIQPEIKDQPEPESQEDGDEVQEPGSRTEFANIAEALGAAVENLRKMPTLNPQTLRMHLVNDLYPILVDFAMASDWYTGDLHGRVTEVEEEVGEESGEGLEPEFAAQLIEFIGVSLQLFGVMVNLCKNDPEVIGKVQLLIAQAPGIISKIQEITMVEEDEEEEDEDEDEEEPEVQEPRSRQATGSTEEAPQVQPAEVTAPSPEVAPRSTTATPTPDMVVNTTTSNPNPGAVVNTTTNGTEQTNG
jgi:hypothetical protein